MVRAAARRPSRAAGRAPLHRTGLPLVKLEAAGNDFLVALVPLLPRATGGSGTDQRLLTPAQVRAVCDRRRGVGADGLIVVRRGGPGADLEMVLYNADGSVAEMSGNGIRCLVHAAVMGGIVPPRTVRVATAAGLRTVAYGPAEEGSAWARVDMGPVRLGPEVVSPLPGTRARLADVGNPHLVAAGDVDLDVVDLESLRAAAARAAGGPVNLEVVRPGRSGADLELRVLERGVGETLSCGTGTCAAAAVAYAWGMVGDTVTVDNPGGRLEVRLGAGGGGPERGGGHGGELGTIEGVELAGPVRKIADVEVDPALFVGAEVDPALVVGAEVGMGLVDVAEVGMALVDVADHEDG